MFLIMVIVFFSYRNTSAVSSLATYIVNLLIYCSGYIVWWMVYVKIIELQTVLLIE